jgi:PAS domain S-box-containing protein
MQMRRETNQANGLAHVAISDFEGALRGKGESYRALVEAAPDIIYALSAEDGTIIFLNPAFERATGYPRSEWIGSSFASLIHPDDVDRATEALRQLLRGESVSRLELRLTTRAGDYLVAEIGAAAEVEDEKVVRVFGFARDVTERKRAAEALRKSEEKYRTILENIDEGYYEVDLTGTITFLNDSMCEILRYPKNELIGLNDRQLTDQETAGKAHHVFRKVYETGESSKLYRCQITRKDGTRGFLEISISLIRDSRGKPSGFRGIVRDVTKRLAAEDALRESEARYKGLVDTAFDGVLVHQDGTIATVNRAYAAMYGYTVEELVGRKVLELTPPEYREFVSTRIAGRVEGRYETLGLRKDGSRINIEVSAKDCLYKGAPARLAAVRDLTETKRAEEALRASGQRYRLLFERNLSGVCRATLDGRILDCNEAFARIFGYQSRDDLLFAGMPGLYGGTNYWNSLLSRLRERRTLNNLELYLERKDGSPVWVLGNVSLVAGNNGDSPVIEGIWMDITERKLSEEELRNSRELLRALSTKLQLIREEERTHIAREIHDQLGQALTSLKIDLSLIADDLPEDGRYLLTRTAAMSKLFDETIQNLRRICSQLRPSALDNLGLTAAIEEELLEWHRRTGVRYDFVSNPQEFTIDAARATAVFRILQEALTNVARHTNAGSVEVHLTQRHGYVELIISDNGIGITEEQVYNPNSLGLIGMRERALQWGGKLDIRRGERGGTQIELVIPLRRLADKRPRPAFRLKNYPEDRAR